MHQCVFGISNNLYVFISFVKLIYINHFIPYFEAQINMSVKGLGSFLGQL